MHLYLMPAYHLLVFSKRITFKLKLIFHLTRAVDGKGYVALLVGQRLAVEHRIHINRLGQFHLRSRLLEDAAVSVRLADEIVDAHILHFLQVSAEYVAHAVNAHLHRIYCLTQLGNVFAHILLAHRAVVHSREVGIKRNHYLLVGKRLPPVWRAHRRHLLVAQILKLLAFP